METEMWQQAQKIFNLAKKTNLLKTENLDDIFPDTVLSEISDNLSKDREKFLQSSQDVENPEKLWEDGAQLRVTSDVSQIFIDYLQKKGMAFALDYDQPLEDIVFNFKSVCSDLDIYDLGESQIDGDWYQSMKIGEEVYKYKTTELGFVQDVLYDIARKLFPISKAILSTNFGDSNQYFVLNLDLAPEFADFGFSTI